MWVCGTFTKIGSQTIPSYGPQIVELSITNTTDLLRKTFTIIASFPSPGANCYHMYPLEDALIVRENSYFGALRIFKDGSLWDRITYEETYILHIDSRADHSTIYVLARDLMKKPDIGDPYFVQKYNAKSGGQWKTVIPASEETEKIFTFTHGTGGDKEIYVTFSSGTADDPDKDEKVFMYNGERFVRLGKGKFSSYLTMNDFLKSNNFELHYDTNSNRLIVYGDDIYWYTVGEFGYNLDKPWNYTSRRLNKIAYYDNVNDIFVPAFGGGFNTAPLKIFDGDNGTTCFIHGGDAIAYDTWSPCKFL